MADKKISELTAATTPLAGTEVLPIVQSSTTVKVATNDLTVKNVRSNATTGILQVAGPGAGTTRVMTTPDANFTAARTDAAQSFTGNQTLADGNLVIGVSGKGIDFSITPNTGTSELFADYEEGTFTPDIFFGDSEVGDFTIVRQAGRYTKIGRIVTIKVYLEWSAIPTGGQLLRFNLPFTALATGGVYNPDAFYPGQHSGTFSDVIGGASALGNAALAQIFKATAGTTGSYTYAQIPASGNMLISGIYEVA